MGNTWSRRGEREREGTLAGGGQRRGSSDGRHVSTGGEGGWGLAGHWAMERERQGIGDGERVLAGERENIPVYWARREFRVSKIISGRLFLIFDHL